MAHIQKKLANYPGSYAVLSPESAVSTAVVLVHGFWGDSLATWRELPGLIDEGKHMATEVASSDFYFYDFKTRANSVNGHASEFLAFLGHIFPQAPDAIFAKPKRSWGALLKEETRRAFKRVFKQPPPPPPPEMKRHGALSYEQLVLVGHSMGGVVVRRALLNDLMASGYSSPYAQARLRLFAPAHGGIRQSLALEALMGSNPVSGVVFGVFSAANRAFNDLLPDSPPLRQLERDHEAMVGHFARYAKVAWGNEEDIVFDTLFAGDVEQRVPNRDHTTVCKARDDYTLPLEMILKK